MANRPNNDYIIQIQNCLARTVVKAPKSSHITLILRSLHWSRLMNALNINSPHSPTKFRQPANLTTYTISSLFSLQVEPAPHLLSICHPGSTICIFVITNHPPLFHLSLPRPFTTDLKIISFTNPFLHSHSYSFRTAFTDLNLY